MLIHDSMYFIIHRSLSHTTQVVGPSSTHTYGEGGGVHIHKPTKDRCDRNSAVSRMIIDFFYQVIASFRTWIRLCPLWMIVWHNNGFKLYQCVLYTSDVMYDILCGSDLTFNIIRVIVVIDFF